MPTNNFAKGVLRPKRVAARIAKVIGVRLEREFSSRVILLLHPCIDLVSDNLSQRYNLTGNKREIVRGLAPVNSPLIEDCVPTFWLVRGSNPLGLLTPLAGL